MQPLEASAEVTIARLRARSVIDQPERWTLDHLSLVWTDDDGHRVSDHLVQYIKREAAA